MCDQKKNEEVLLLEIECKRCHKLFYICRSCYHGHVYCGDSCRNQSKREAHRKAQSKYRKSKKGKRANKLGQRRRRIKINKKTKADRGTKRINFPDILKPDFFIKEPKCCLCGSKGRVVKHFPHRK